jgi:hypothetical protein
VSGVFTFGKYNGMAFENVPSDYFEWLIGTRKKDIEAYQAELDRRAAAEVASLTMTERIIVAGYRALAKTMHPDVGGSKEQFQELQGSYEQLKSVMVEVKGVAAK